MIEKKKINQEEMQKYIQLLNLTFKPLKDFKSIKYAQEDRTGLEFMKIPSMHVRYDGLCILPY